MGRTARHRGMKQSDEPLERGRRREDEGRSCQPPAVQISQQWHWAQARDNGKTARESGGYSRAPDPVREKPLTAGGWQRGRSRKGEIWSGWKLEGTCTAAPVLSGNKLKKKKKNMLCKTQLEWIKWQWSLIWVNVPFEGLMATSSPNWKTNGTHDCNPHFPNLKAISTGPFIPQPTLPQHISECKDGCFVQEMYKKH